MSVGSATVKGPFRGRLLSQYGCVVSMSPGSVREISRRSGSFGARAPPSPGAPAQVTETDSSVTGRDERFRIIVATFTLAPGAAEGSLATASTQMPRQARTAAAMV